MVTTLFLIIVFFRRNRFLTKETFWTDKAMYYVLSVVLTPYFGPKAYLWIQKDAAEYGTYHRSKSKCCDTIDSIDLPDLF